MCGIDQPLTPAKLARCSEAAIVVLSVPVAALDSVLSLLQPHLRAHTILTDITSVKMLPMALMQKYHSGPIVGTHPLFGPSLQPDSLRVCLVPGENTPEPALIAVEAIYTAMGCTTFRSTAQAHDRAMAAIQSLNFITSVAYFAMLAQHTEYTPFLTPSFERRKEAARKLLTEDAPLFTGFQESNPMATETVREYRNYLNLAAGGDVDILVQLAKPLFQGAPLED